MKTILLAASLLAIAQFSFAQSEIEQPLVNPTEATVKAFKAAYPEARGVNWDKVCIKHDYMATFKSGEQEITVTYDENGKLMSTEKPITMKDVPQAAADYMQKNHPSLEKYKEITKTVDLDGNVTYEIKGGGEVHVFDKDGKFVRSR